MTQIRDKETERDGGAWAQMAAEERSRVENEFRHMGMIARFHNVMGVETVRVLGMLTEHIRAIFLHDILVERLASMLNYFLVHLVRLVSMSHSWGGSPDPAAKVDDKVREMGSNTNRLIDNRNQTERYSAMPRLSTVPIQVRRIS